MAPKNVTTASFQADVLSNPKPVMVDFWAEWCGPCRMVSPILDEIAAEYSGQDRDRKSKRGRRATASHAVWRYWNPTNGYFSGWPASQANGWSKA